MSNLLLKLEPLIWLMFGQGIMLGTMLLTGWCLVVGVAIPLGLVDASVLGFGRAHGLASGLIGRLVLAALIALPMWKGAHHIQSFLIDLGNGDRATAIKTVVYLIATGGTAAAILAVARL
jgi:fumarate reductase subunit D